jgi:elongation factor G
MEPNGKYQIIKAQVPAAEMQRYAIELKSMTQGRGFYKMDITGYEEIPPNMADKVIAARKAERAEEK